MNAKRLSDVISNVDKLRQAFIDVCAFNLAADLRDACLILMDKRDALKKEEKTCETCGKAKD